MKFLFQIPIFINILYLLKSFEKVEKLIFKLFTSLEYLVKDLPFKEKIIDLKIILEEIIFWIKPLCEDKNLSLDVDIP